MWVTSGRLFLWLLGVTHTHTCTYHNLFTHFFYSKCCCLCETLTVRPERQRRWRAEDPGVCHRVLHQANVAPHVRRLHLGDVKVPRVLGDEAAAVLGHEGGELVKHPAVDDLCRDRAEDFSNYYQQLLQSVSQSVQTSLQWKLWRKLMKELGSGFLCVTNASKELWNSNIFIGSSFQMTIMCSRKESQNNWGLFYTICNAAERFLIASLLITAEYSLQQQSFNEVLSAASTLQRGSKTKLPVKTRGKR